MWPIMPETDSAEMHFTVKRIFSWPFWGLLSATAWYVPARFGALARPHLHLPDRADSFRVRRA